MIKATNTVLPKTLFPFIWHFLRSHKFIVMICIICNVISGFWGPFNSMLIKHIIDILPSVENGDVSMLILPASLVPINFIIFDNITWRIWGYLCDKYVPIIQNNILSSTMEYCLMHSHGFYQNHLSGKISKQITNLVDGVTDIITFCAANFLRGASLLLLIFVISYHVNPIFCLILIVWFICFAGFSLGMSKKLVVLSDELADSESIVVGELVDSLSNHSNIRIFSRRIYENLRMIPILLKQQHAYTKANSYSTFLALIQGSLIAIMMSFSAFFLVRLYGLGSITAGEFAMIFAISMEAGHMMWFTMAQADKFNKAVGRCKQSLMALMLPLEVLDKPNASILNCTHGKITFDNVKFHYKGTEPLFQNKSIEITAGQKVGLVGYSGGGKSTFVNLILRLYDVTDGAILIDGHNIRDITQDSLRENIAMIPQDPSLFHRSLMENIRYGRIDASDEEVIEAAKKAHAHEFISTLPQGYDSLVGERGVKLSGGQRQRIAIARAILKNAPILILDEATSQLDSVTEILIQESLLELMNSTVTRHHERSDVIQKNNNWIASPSVRNDRSRTTIVIAHRLSTLLHMDRILVFDKGKIVEDGTHSELLAKAGLYKHLWDAQVGGFLGDEMNDNEE